ncbi:VOC family protein [Rubrolithibacter danxiaensis]|uniref:VOC family protein n=1 Tax=Rubrolithibacter danxiaensis TaxID=3390805 RepID=UPI003BF80FA1
MTTINPYVNFPGNTEKAFNFYKSVFGGEFLAVIRFKDTPEAARVPEDEKNKIMHIALPIGNNILMATDALESMGHTINSGNNYHISISPESKEEAIRLFNELSEGGIVHVPIEKMFWGYFGMFTDKFGIQWMVNYDEKAN